MGGDDERTFIRGLVVEAERLNLALDANNGPGITGIGLDGVRIVIEAQKPSTRTT